MSGAKELDLFFDVWGFRLPNKEKYYFIYETIVLSRLQTWSKYKNPHRCDHGYALALRYGWDGLGQKTYKEAGKFMPRALGGTGVGAQRMRSLIFSLHRRLRRREILSVVYNYMEPEDKAVILKHIPKTNPEFWVKHKVIYGMLFV